ncbi:cwf21-domain-containing protein, partial [Acaromyces ingoldii]
MSYNGIGLPTARGTGTNGYIQKNLSHVRPRDDYRSKKTDSWRDDKAKQREPDAGILEHERKRKVEVGCMELRIKLEDEGFGDAEIEEQVQELRKTLLAQFERQPAIFGGPTRQETKALRPSDVHALGAAKRAETESMQRALGIREGYREGDAFDRDLQEKLKQERIEERKRR